MQIFIAMDYSILMPEKYVHFRKWQKHVLRNLFSPRISNWIHLLRNYFSSYVYTLFYKHLGKIGLKLNLLKSFPNWAWSYAW